MTDISIVVILDKYRDNLKECYNSITKQLNDNHELFIWDNIENKENKNNIEKEENKNIHYYTGSEKSLIRKLKGKYTICLSSNDILEENALQTIEKYLKNKEADIVITDYYLKINDKKKNISEKSFTIKERKKVDNDIKNILKNNISNKIVKTILIKNSNKILEYNNYTNIGKIDKPTIITKNKAKNKLEIKKYIKNNIIIITMFILMFLCGIMSIKNVGGYFDEDSEKDILRMNIISFCEKLKIKRSYAEKLRGMGLISITESVERDHGIAPYYPYIIFLNLHNGYLESMTWHVYTYIICFIGIICMYLILKKILKNKYLSIIFAATYYFSPRIFSDSMYNNKDMILLTLLIISLFLLIKLLDKKSYSIAILLAIVCAFLCNVKILGFYFVAIYGIIYYIDLILKKEFTLKNNIIGIITILTWFICYIFITPAIWCGNDGFKLIEHIKWGLEQSSNFSRLRPIVRFQGIEYMRDANPLPWYYIPKMIIITSPLIVILLFIMSIAFVFKGIIKAIVNKQNIDESIIIEIISIALFITPFAIATFNKPNVYNGWRHFYFLYGLIIIIASYTIKCFQTKKYTKKTINYILIISLGYYLIGNLINGVGGMTYYNILVNNNKNLNYETDYYGVTTKKTIEKMLNKYPNKIIYIYSREGSSSQASLMTSVGKMRAKYIDRVKVINTEEEYMQLKQKGKFVLYFYNTNYNKKEEIKNMKSIYTYQSWYKTVNGFYK